MDTNKAQEHEFTYSQNLQYEKDFHCAWKTVVDVNNKSLKECYGLLAWNNSGHGNFYFRSNCMKNLVGLGWSHNLKELGTHTTEAQWDFKDKKAALFGLPLTWRHGAFYKLGNNMKLH